MSGTLQRMTDTEFYRQLNDVRAKIDSIPEVHRAALRAGADSAEVQYERMRRTSASIDDMVANLGLIVEHTKFHVAACRRELRQRDPKGLLQL
jgi:hypothetical protein